MGWEEWFDLDLDLWTCDLKINRDYLLIEGNPCTKFGIDQVKGSKDIERTTLWAEKSGLTLTFEHVTWKSTDRQTDIPTDRPTYQPTVAKQYAPFFKGGIIKNFLTKVLDS